MRLVRVTNGLRTDEARRPPGLRAACATYLPDRRAGEFVKATDRPKVRVMIAPRPKASSSSSRDEGTGGCSGIGTTKQSASLRRQGRASTKAGVSARYLLLVLHEGNEKHSN